MAESLDFQINDLKFRAAISDKFPYARATAPFRKEQFDSAPTVGDQSLAGWWTRGQLSFHKGAGLKYYEVLSGEEILDRYDDSLRAEVSDPGKVTLVPALSDLGVAATKAVPGTLSGGEGLFALTGTGVQFYNGSTATAMATSDGGVPTDITSDGRYYYVCNGNKIERQSSTALARTNHVTNPSLETGVTGWTDTSAAGPATLAQSSVVSKYGSYSLEVTSGSTGSAIVKLPLGSLTVGATYKFSAWVYIPAGSDAAPYLNFVTSSPSATADPTLVDQWQYIHGYLTATTSTPGLAVMSFEHSPGAIFYIDAAMVVESPFDGDYFDGDSVGGSWSGTAHASTSTFASSAPGSSNVLWEHGQAGAVWRGVWWAKGRLWAVDSAGRWFMLSTVGGTASDSDSFWPSGRLEGKWTLAEGPSAIYAAIDTDIYTVTLDTDGSVPQVSAPPVAATVPLNETISHIDHYLGSLIICTDAGVRVGTSGNGAEIIYGAIVIAGDFSSANAIGKRGTRVFVVGEPDSHGTSTVCALDLGSEIVPLQPAWYPYHEVGATTSTLSGATFSGDGNLYAWSASSLYGADGALAATAYLKTGLHRFGTLEGKHFSGVKVRVGGDAGTVDVYLVERSGTETLLGTIDAAIADGADISLGMSGPAEAIGLKFVLNKVGLEGPELLGYQLKALPSPIRQRLIQWPVVAADAYRDRYGKEHGRRDGAWDAWETLESLEENDALVTYTDHRTGETGEAFIESIELQSDTPSQGATSGFGGVGMITLRKVG